MLEFVISKELEDKITLIAERYFNKYKPKTEDEITAFTYGAVFAGLTPYGTVEDVKLLFSQNVEKVDNRKKLRNCYLAGFKEFRKYYS